MPEHIHEWTPGDTYDDCFWVCGCGKELEGSAITRRLNATEKLSANAADYAAEFTHVGTNKHGMDQESEGNIYYLTDALRAYASALEGTNEPG